MLDGQVYITIDMYKCMVKTYNVLNSIWQTHATVDLCVCFQLTCVALVWVRDQVDFCADIIIFSVCTPQDHNLNNLGIRHEIWQNLFGKIDFVY